MSTPLYDDVPARRRGSEAPERRERRDDEGRRGSGESSDYPDRMGQGRRRRDRDLTELDRLHCLSTGDKARSDYVAANEEDMRDRETAFATAQSAYVTARATVAAGQKAIEDRLADIRKRVLCLLEDDKDRIKELDLAWLRVKDRHERCERRLHEHRDIGDCHFPCDADGQLDDLLAQQATYQDRVTRAEAEFARLILEPAELTTRGTDLETAVDNLEKALDTPPVDADAAFAELLVAEYHHATIWGDFDSANEYEDSLRACLRCSIHGREALRVIIGEIAVRQCRWAKKQERCAWLAAHLATEIIAEAKEIEHHEARRPPEPA